MRDPRLRCLPAAGTVTRIQVEVKRTRPSWKTLHYAKKWTSPYTPAFPSSLFSSRPGPVPPPSSSSSLILFYQLAPTQMKLLRSRGGGQPSGRRPWSAAEWRTLHLQTFPSASEKWAGPPGRTLPSATMGSGGRGGIDRLEFIQLREGGRRGRGGGGGRSKSGGEEAGREVF